MLHRSPAPSVAAAPHRQAHPDRAWMILVGVGIMAAVHIWKLPVALPLLEAELGIGLMASGLLIGMIQLASMVGGLAVAWGGELAGLRRLVVLGLVLLAAGSLCGAFTSSITLLMVYRAIEGIGFLLCTVLAPALIRRTCLPARLNVAMSAWGAFQGTATILGFAAGGLVLPVIGWRGLWVGLAILTCLLLVPVMRYVPADVPHPSPTRLRSSGRRIVNTITTRRPWLAGLTFACYTLQWMAVIGFLPTVFIAANIAPVHAALLSAVIGGVNVIGALMAARFLGRGINPRHIVITTFATMAVTSVLFFGIDWGHSAAGLVGQLVCATVFSMVGGTVPAILSRLAVDLAPANGSVAAVIGLMQQIFNVGNFLGPSLLAWVALTAGSWNASWWVTCSFSAMGIVCVMLLTRTRRTSRTPE